MSLKKAVESNHKDRKQIQKAPVPEERILKIAMAPNLLIGRAGTLMI